MSEHWKRGLFCADTVCNRRPLLCEAGLHQVRDAVTAEPPAVSRNYQRSPVAVLLQPGFAFLTRACLNVGPKQVDPASGCR